MKVYITEITIEIAGWPRVLQAEISKRDGELFARVCWAEYPDRTDHPDPWLEAGWLWELISDQQYRRLMEQFDRYAEEMEVAA